MEDGPFKVRFEGLMWVIKDEPPPVEPPPTEPPPAEPAESTTRLAQYAIGASAHRDAPKTDPHDIRVRPATYGWSAHAPSVAGPGWVVQLTMASWEWLAHDVSIAVERCVRQAWEGAFNEDSFNRCTWNSHVFGQAAQ